MELTSINFPDSVTDIGEAAFWACLRLNIAIPNGIESIGRFAFYVCALDDVTIPASVTFIGDGAFSGCRPLSAIKVDANNQAYKAIDGVLFTKDGTELVAYPSGKKDSSYTVPNGVRIIKDNSYGSNTYLRSVVFSDSVTEIGFQSFSGCSNLKNISLGSGVIRIEHYAFADTGLTNVFIPSGVEKIVGSAFSGCSRLSAFEVDPNNPHYTSFEGVVFSKDLSTLAIYPSGRRYHYSIPNGTTTIGEWAFTGNNRLTSVYIPISVTNIERDAFWQNDALFDVYYKGSAADRENLLTIDFNNSSLTNAEWHYNCIPFDGTVE